MYILTAIILSALVMRVSARELLPNLTAGGHRSRHELTSTLVAKLVDNVFDCAIKAPLHLTDVSDMTLGSREARGGDRSFIAGRENWTNVIVKNIPCGWDDARLEQEFEAFGDVLSAKLGFSKAFNGSATDGRRNIESKRFGFVDFAEHESALKAVEARNGKAYSTIFDEEKKLVKLFVERFQDRVERNKELSTSVHIENLDKGITDMELHDVFSPCGTVIRAEVRTVSPLAKRSRGVVRFKMREEAVRAIHDMQGKLVAGSPIHVSLVLDEEAAKHQLGELLYPRVEQIQPARAGVITGMLLELDIDELLRILDGRKMLASTVEEVVDFLDKDKLK